MRVLFHVFTILGAGHLQRARAIADALAPHGVIWAGHQPAGASGTLVDRPVVVHADPPTPEDAAACIQAGQHLARQIAADPPDLLLTEHFPFGSDVLDDAFLPVLQAAKVAGVPIVASVRDVLGKDREWLGWAKRATRILNHWYKAVLWHGDPQFLPWDFPLADYLTIPVLPSGYVRTGTSPSWQPAHRHWVASCGSGRGDGFRFSQAVLDAQRQLSASDWRLTLVCGRETWEHLQPTVSDLPAGVTLLPWTDDLPALLATATVSVSQCGYNTGLEVLGSGVPAVFVPYVEPRSNEQRLRAEAIAVHPGYRVIPPFIPDLADRLAEAVCNLEGLAPSPPALAMNGATTSARLLANLMR